VTDEWHWTDVADRWILHGFLGVCSCCRHQVCVGQHCRHCWRRFTMLKSKRHLVVICSPPLLSRQCCLVLVATSLHQYATCCGISTDCLCGISVLLSNNNSNLRALLRGMPSVLWHCWLGGRKASGLQKYRGMEEVALVSPDGVASSWMVSVSASVNLPLHLKVQKFFCGTSSPGGPRKRAIKRLCVCVCVCYVVMCNTPAVLLLHKTSLTVPCGHGL